jgi:outer membrane protein
MKQILILILSIGISALIGGLVYNTIPKTAFVDNRQLFEAFEGRKELEHRLEQESSSNKAKLDSLSLRIKAGEKQVQLDQESAKYLYSLKQQYQQLSQVYQGSYQEKSQEYTEAIWKQISQYTIEYGESKGYDYIFGIAGQGTLMYGKEHYDITKEVVEYVNSKYAGN